MQERVKKETDRSAAEKSEEQAGRFRHVVDHARMHDGLDDGDDKRHDGNPEKRSTGRPAEGPDRRDRETEVPRCASRTKRERAIKHPERAGRKLMTDGVDDSIPAFAVGKPHYMLKHRCTEGDNHKTGSKRGEEKPHAYMDGTAQRERRHSTAGILDIKPRNDTPHSDGTGILLLLHCKNTRRVQMSQSVRKNLNMAVRNRTGSMPDDTGKRPSTRAHRA